MKLGILILSLALSWSAWSSEGQNALVIESTYDVFSGEYLDDVISNVITDENLKDARVEHYFFQDEDEVYGICYTGDVNIIMSMVEEILNRSTGDSWQEVGEPKVENNTIVYPYSYVGEAGEVSGLEAVVPPCQ